MCAPSVHEKLTHAGVRQAASRSTSARASSRKSRCNSTAVSRLPVQVAQAAASSDEGLFVEVDGGQPDVACGSAHAIQRAGIRTETDAQIAAARRLRRDDRIGRRCGVCGKERRLRVDRQTRLARLALDLELLRELPFVEDLQQDVQYIPMGFLDLVEQDDLEGTAA